MSEITVEEIEEGLTSPNLEIRKKFAVDKRFTLTQFQIERGLKDKSPIIRYMFASRCSDIGGYLYGDESLTSKQIKRGLKDPNDSVRAIFVQNNKFTSKDEIDAVMKDRSAEVKKALTYNSSIELTQKQIQNGANSNSKIERCAFIYCQALAILNDKIFVHSEFNRKENINVEMINDLYSYLKTNYINFNIEEIDAYQLERGLTSHLKNVRKFFVIYAYLNRFYGELTQNQLDRGLKDECPFIRKCFSNWSFVVDLFTDKQIKHGLKDRCPLVRASFVGKANINLTEDNIIDIFEDDSYYVTGTYIGRHGISLTEKQIEKCLISKHYAIKLAIISQPRIEITKEQIIRGLEDENEDVRESFILSRRGEKYINDTMLDRLLAAPSTKVKVAILCGTNCKLTEEQKRCLLKDKDASVRSEFVKRYGHELTSKQVEFILENDEPKVRSAVLKNKHIDLTPYHIEMALNDKSTRIRSYVFGSDRLNLSPSQIDCGLMDVYYVRICIAKNKKIELTEKQVNYMLKDRSEEIVKVVQGRQEYKAYNKKEKRQSYSSCF